MEEEQVFLPGSSMWSLSVCSHGGLWCLHLPVDSILPHIAGWLPSTVTHWADSHPYLRCSFFPWTLFIDTPDFSERSTSPALLQAPCPLMQRAPAVPSPTRSTKCRPWVFVRGDTLIQICSFLVCSASDLKTGCFLCLPFLYSLAFSLPLSGSLPITPITC